VIFGDGTQSRDFTYVSNVVDANVLAACAPGAAGGIFNVACGEQVTLLEVLVLLQQLVGTTRPPRHLAARAGDVRHSHAAIDRAREALGYRPSVLFAEGLALTVRAFRESLPVAA
jgi:UDP-glucose 4-epimerase